MFITHSYLGRSLGPYRCLFFLLVEDYVEVQSQFVRELDLELERFARNLGDSAPVVKPFMGDIDATRSHVLEKPWTDNEKHEIRKTPGLLMINVDFDIFDPNRHPWIHLHFQERMQGARDTIGIRGLLGELALAVRNSDKDIFQEAHKLQLQHQLSLEDVASVFEAKPGMFGFSVDLIEGAKVLQVLFSHIREKS